MKKYLLLLIPFLLTGCFGANNDFQEKCEYVQSSTGFNDTSLVNVQYNHKDEVNKVTFTKKLLSTDQEGDITLESAKESAQDLAATYGKTKGITISQKSKTRYYKLVYSVDIKKASSTTLKRFNIKTNSNKYIEYLKKTGYNCKNAS